MYENHIWVRKASDGKKCDEQMNHIEAASGLRLPWLDGTAELIRELGQKSEKSAILIGQPVALGWMPAKGCKRRRWREQAEDLMGADLGFGFFNAIVSPWNKKLRTMAYNERVWNKASTGNILDVNLHGRRPVLHCRIECEGRWWVCSS